MALDLLDRLARYGLAVPAIVADAGYVRSATFRPALEERGWSYVSGSQGDRTARRRQAVSPACGGLGYWMSNLPLTTPIATNLGRWAKIRWRIEHDCRELKHDLGLDHFGGRTWRGRHHHVSLVTAAQAFLTLRWLDLKAQPLAGQADCRRY